MKVVDVKGGVAVFLSEHSGNCNVLEFVIEEGPFVTESDHSFNAFLTFLLERYGGGGLRGGVRYWYRFRTGCLLFLRWGWEDRGW